MFADFTFTKATKKVCFYFGWITKSLWIDCSGFRSDVCQDQLLINEWKSLGAFPFPSIRVSWCPFCEGYRSGERHPGRSDSHSDSALTHCRPSVRNSGLFIDCPCSFELWETVSIISHHSTRWPASGPCFFVRECCLPFNNLPSAGFFVFVFTEPFISNPIHTPSLFYHFISLGT